MRVKLSARTPQKKLKLLLIDRDLQLADVVRGTGLSISLIEKISTGHRQPTPRTAARIENFLGVRIFSKPAQYRSRRRRVATRTPATIAVNQGRPYVLPVDVEIEFANEEEAIAAEKEFAGHVTRAGAKILFIKPTPVTIGGSEAQ